MNKLWTGIAKKCHRFDRSQLDSIEMGKSGLSYNFDVNEKLCKTLSYDLSVNRMKSTYRYTEIHLVVMRT